MIMMQEFGYLATMGVDSVGDPQISSQVSSTSFSVYFYGCTDGLNCTNIQFAAGYDLTNGTTAEAMNNWNASKRFAYSYIDDEGDPFLNMDVNLDYDGIGEQNLRDFFSLWREQVEAGENHIGW